MKKDENHIMAKEKRQKILKSKIQGEKKIKRTFD